MKTLAEYNAERTRKRIEFDNWMRNPHVNGIACPKCGKELWDSSPSITLTSNPPKKNVHCPACGFKGYRIA